ncbi:hypothetical protein Bca52824_045027 [Brassica carinata]|uniref:Uncharacterized protein n=1 Tax=Brassica carinata TaxID=52824 RepID=A0A8X7REK3_BRACI|nr:hypothetical protein Bca52824_045027 [Brassica carinata]
MVKGLLSLERIIRSGVVLQQLKDQDRDFDESEADDEYRGQKKDKDFESFVALQLGRGRVRHRNQRLSRPCVRLKLMPFTVMPPWSIRGFQMLIKL